MPQEKAERISEAMVRYGYAAPPDAEGESRMLLSVEGFELLYLAKRGLYAADEVGYGLQ